jgi:hypothetical protein
MTPAALPTLSVAVSPSAMPTMTPSALPTITPTEAPTTMTPSALPTVSPSVSFQDDIDKEGQACAAMAAAIPQLQTYTGRNHYNLINIIYEQYHLSSSSYERIHTF